MCIFNFVHWSLSSFEAQFASFCCWVKNLDVMFCDVKNVFVFFIWSISVSETHIPATTNSQRLDLSSWLYSIEVKAIS